MNSLSMPELVAEEALAVDELANERLAARHVRVGFDPHAAFGQELARLYGVADALIERGVVVLDHPIEVGAGL